MTNEETIKKLRRFLLTEIIQDPEFVIEDDEPLMSGGVIDSFTMPQIAVFIEQELGVTIPDPELTVEKMDTLELMAANVERYRT